MNLRQLKKAVVRLVSVVLGSEDRDKFVVDNPEELLNGEICYFLCFCLG